MNGPSRSSAINKIVNNIANAVKESEKLQIGQKRRPNNVSLNRIETIRNKICLVGEKMSKLVSRNICPTLDNTNTNFIPRGESLIEQLSPSISSCLSQIEDLNEKEIDKVKTTTKMETIKTTQKLNNKMFITAPGSNFGGTHSAKQYRPQLYFKRKIDNSESPFVPFISHKPNSITPLCQYKLNKPIYDYEHPYRKEILSFAKKPLENNWNVDCFEMKYKNGKPLHIDEVPCHWIDTLEGLKKMITRLKSETEIAIDLENFDFGSYQGFLCLIQISSHSTDFLIDSLALHDELHCLNEITTDPKIMKVMHDTNCDVLWFQRDFCVYLVNLFDTSLACKTLNYERTGLSALLERFCGLKKEKKLQRADWRKRPLTTQLIQYARTDTRFLLFLKDNLLIQLNEKNLDSGGTANLVEKLKVQNGSLCLKRYFKPKLDEQLIKKFINRFKTVKREPLDLLLFYRLFLWRDRKARELDSNWAFVLNIRTFSEIINKRIVHSDKIHSIMTQRGSRTKGMADEIAEICSKAIKDFGSDVELRNKFTNKAKVYCKRTKKAKPNLVNEEIKIPLKKNEEIVLKRPKSQENKTMETKDKLTAEEYERIVITIDD